MSWTSKTAVAICSALAFAAALTAPVAQAAEGRGDYDGDGLSDFMVAHTNRVSGSTALYVQLASGAQASYSFGAAADAVVTGRFFPEKKSYPGVVLAESGRPLQWYIKTPGPADAHLQFGSPGDHLPNQGDVDCDGITDIAVVRNTGNTAYPGFKIWYIALSASATVQEIAFGNSRDGAAIADVDGDSCDELIALREGFHWFSRKLDSTEAKVVQWGLPGDAPLLPADINNDGLPDFAVVRDTPGGALMLVRHGKPENASDSEFTVERIGAAGTVAVLGNFGTGIRSASINRASGVSTLNFDAGWEHPFNFGNLASAIVRPDGSVVPPLENGSFFRTAAAGRTSLTREYEDAVAEGCERPRLPDGINKRRAWVPTAGGIGVGYTLQGPARKIELFSAAGSLIDSMNLVEPGTKKKRELWSTGMSVADLTAFAPLLLKETGMNGRCSVLDIPNPAGVSD